MMDPLNVGTTERSTVLGGGPTSPPQESPGSVNPAVRIPLTGSLLPGIVALLVACVVALVIARLTALAPDRPEQALTLVGALFALLLPIPVIAYAIANRRAIVPERVAIVALLSLTVLLTGLDIYWLGAHVVFPADILIWSESDFVNDIIKLRIGYPLYTAQANNESFIYTPGSQVLTWLLASLAGKGTSIVAYRAIQVGYTVAAAIVAVLCCRRLIALAVPSRSPGSMTLWSALWLPAFFLLASNAITNPFVQNLHNDALAQLVTITGYWLLLEYSATRDRRILWLMALLPAAGFLVKQSLVVWAPLYCFYLAIFDRPRSVRLTATFAAVSFGMVALTIAACYVAWGEPFTYWTFNVLKAHPFSLMRTAQHIVDAWAFFAMGIAGGLVLMRGERMRVLVGPWLFWLVLFLFGAYTSGIAWMLNHLGPGSLIAGTWFLAAVALSWTDVVRGAQRAAARDARGLIERWVRPAAVATIGGLLLAGLGTVRIPVPPFPKDATRYVTQIESELQRVPTTTALLDAGSWVYLQDGVVMKDRAPSFGDRGYGQVGDFSQMIRRLEERHYARILLRNYHSADFWYDHYLWRTPSGVRQALRNNYREAGTIPAVREGDPTRRPRYLFSEISILVPNTTGSSITRHSGPAVASFFPRVR